MKHKIQITIDPHLRKMTSKNITQQITTYQRTDWALNKEPQDRNDLLLRLEISEAFEIWDALLVDAVFHGVREVENDSKLDWSSGGSSLGESRGIATDFDSSLHLDGLTTTGIKYCKFLKWGEQVIYPACTQNTTLVFVTSYSHIRRIRSSLESGTIYLITFPNRIQNNDCKQ